MAVTEHGDSPRRRVDMFVEIAYARLDETAGQEEILRKNGRLLIGCAASILLLMVILVLRFLWPDLLSVDPEWLALAVIPALIGLIAAGYVRAFKGFGIEIEASLESSIDDIPLGVKDITRIEDVSKAGIGALHAMEPSQRVECESLSFVESRSNYYKPDIVCMYMEKLPNLRLLEVRDEKGRFRALLPISVLQEDDMPSELRISEFIQAIEEGDPDQDVITEEAKITLKLGTPLFEALESFKSVSREELPVVRRGRLIGIAGRDLLQDRLLEAIKKARKRA